MQIQDKALLVKLAIGMPGNGRKDKSITAEVTQKHALAANAGRWNKTLYPPEAFTPLVEVAGAARTYHYEVTLPWLDEGFRILPTLVYQEYTDKMRKTRSQFETLAESHFIGQLPDWEAKARKMHNGTFNAADYLPACKLRKKFNFATEFIPIPSTDDFRVKFSDSELEVLKSQMEDKLTEAVRNAEADLWRRLAEPLQHLADKLKDPDAKFRDSIISNLSDVCALIPKINLLGDKRLAAFADQVQANLASLNPQRLRDFASDRNAARLAADNILSKMQAYMPAGGAE
jgi:hypothetical protein